MELDIGQGITYLIILVTTIFGATGLAKYRKAKKALIELLTLAKDLANLTKVYKAASADGVYTDEEKRKIGEAAIPLAEMADKYI